MLDFHSHFLPKMDDGSKSTEMSMEMLRASKAQGVDVIVSTSHFYGYNEAPDRFLKRREHAYQKLSPLLSDSEPKVVLGAEILYYPGISQSDDIASLAIEGTDLLLIEMPFIPWSEKVFDELITLQYSTRLQIVLAHVERYKGMQKKDIYNRLFDQPFLFQCNAEAFGSFSTRRLALSLMNEGLLHFIGTDCHNIESRPPNMDDARRVIEKKLSPAAWQMFSNECEERFRQHQKQ